MNAVEVGDLERRFGYERVLSQLELTVEPGERVTISGPNGSGKTTLLRILSGLLRATTGHVAVLGSAPNDLRVRRRVGVIGHAAGIYPRMTAIENLRFWGRLYEAEGAEARGAELLARLGLDPKDRRVVGAYSQGMRQRVAIARALCTSPELVVADEPLAALDERGATTVAALLAEGRTLIAATHDATPFIDSRRLVLQAGRLHPA